jgi:hypothetical protein
MFRGSKVASVAALILGAHCSDPEPEPECGKIADGGCPEAPDACLDPTCFALFACTAAGWSQTRTCERAPGADAGAGPRDAADAAVDVGTRIDVSAIEGAFGGPSCSDLQAPDCSLGTGALCPSGCCDCEDLFVCRDGWVVWGSCVDGAIVAKDGG